MTLQLLAGLTDENLVSRRQPYFVKPGRCSQVTRPFRELGGSVAHVDASGVNEYPEFLAELNRALPLPFGGITNWDWWVDSYEDIAHYWPSSVMLVIEGIDVLAVRDLHLAMELTHFMLNTRRGLSQYGTALTVIFCTGEQYDASAAS